MNILKKIFGRKTINDSAATTSDVLSPVECTDTQMTTNGICRDNLLFDKTLGQYVICMYCKNNVDCCFAGDCNRQIKYEK